MSLTRTRMTGICVGLLVGMLHGSVWAQPTADLLLHGGLVYNGTWDAPVRQDVAITGDRISFVGDARQAGLRAKEVVDVAGLMLTPGFIDMHSHAALVEDYGRAAQPFLYQGITTVAIGTDGSGTPEITQLFDSLTGRIGVNAFTYVGHGEIRERVLGQDDRAPTLDELDEMRVLVRQGMEQGAFGLSSGLFYVPGYYATTDEVIELTRIAADYGGVYDTHDRDLGATYQGVGYLNSIREAIRIGETARTRVIFSHFNAQGSGTDPYTGVTGIALQYNIAFMQEITVKGVTKISSPYPTPKASNAACKVVVPELKDIAYRCPNLSAKAFSNLEFIDPLVELANPESNTSFIYENSSDPNLQDKSPITSL